MSQTPNIKNSAVETQTAPASQNKRKPTPLECLHMLNGIRRELHSLGSYVPVDLLDVFSTVGFPLDSEAGELELAFPADDELAKATALLKEESLKNTKLRIDLARAMDAVLSASNMFAALADGVVAPDPETFRAMRKRMQEGLVRSEDITNNPL